MGHLMGNLAGRPSQRLWYYTDGYRLLRLLFVAVSPFPPGGVRRLSFHRIVIVY